MEYTAKDMAFVPVVAHLRCLTNTVVFAVLLGLVALIQQDAQPKTARVQGSLFAGMKGLWLCKGMATGWAVCGDWMDMNPGVGEFAAQINYCVPTTGFGGA